jgi:hypothetical protein
LGKKRKYLQIKLSLIAELSVSIKRHTNQQYDNEIFAA